MRMKCLHNGRLCLNCPNLIKLMLHGKLKVALSDIPKGNLDLLFPKYQQLQRLPSLLEHALYRGGSFVPLKKVKMKF